MIVSGPENAKDRVGKNVALVCEATGYPIPTIEWTWTRVDGKTVYLPSDDLHVSVNMRGGPEKWQITGWLQVHNSLISVMNLTFHLTWHKRSGKMKHSRQNVLRICDGEAFSGYTFTGYRLI